MKKIIITIVSLVLSLAILVPLSVKASSQTSKVYTVKFIDENNVKEVTLSSGNKALATSLLIDSKEVAEGSVVTPPDFKCQQELQHRGRERQIRLVEVLGESQRSCGELHGKRRQEAGILLLQGGQ